MKSAPRTSTGSSARPTPCTSSSARSTTSAPTTTAAPTKYHFAPWPGSPKSTKVFIQASWRRGVQMMANPVGAEMRRMMHPQRLRYTMFSDANPFMAGGQGGGRSGCATTASKRRPTTRCDRSSAAWSNLSSARSNRPPTDATSPSSRCSRPSGPHPLVQALAGEKATHADSAKPAASRRRALEQLRDLKLEAIAAREHEGGFADAVLRVIYAAVKAGKRVDAQAFTAARESG